MSGALGGMHFPRSDTPESRRMPDPRNRAFHYYPDKKKIVTTSGVQKDLPPRLSCTGANQKHPGCKIPVRFFP